MRHSKQWNIIVVPENGSGCSSIRLSKLKIIIIIGFLSIPLAGNVRFGYFIFNELYKKWSFHKEKISNCDLRMQHTYISNAAKEIMWTKEYNESAIWPILKEYTFTRADIIPLGKNFLNFDARLYIENFFKSDKIQTLSSTFLKKRDTESDFIPSLSPVKGDITSGYGARTDPVYEEFSFHSGVDIANKSWAPIVATAAGTVVYAGKKDLWGNLIIIDHGRNGYTTLFAHLVKMNVRPGDRIRRYDCIGFLGSTGKSTGPHLHYEVHLTDKALNPIDFMKPRGIIVD